ncbi:TonB-dependent receptor [Kordiimonas sp. SCSIO 12603]|uniref:TonB-dependent receptor n=1 Tax=Kordiimonas sp. SCSIO 12603 TaxID=2829596 RepID=UPI0021050CEC|nr:TonB-dependent receptor [Kordiimonas sp. SCSIO 12603]UTW58595.1 TonB-dependent receptor [Kordiimonas sp. SCSIO 12603]
MKYLYLAAFAALPVLPAASALARTETEPSEANTDDIETITVIGEAAFKNATLGGTNLSELPLASHVVNRAEIDRLRFVDPDELLDRIPGETQVRNLRIPAGGKSYTVPLVDGLPLASPYNGATQDITTVNSFDIERVEVIKGPSSALFANNAFGGVINVVTRDAPEEFEGRVWAEAGSFDRRRAGVSAAGTFGDFGFFLDANTQNLDGLRDTFKNDRDQFSGKLIYSPSDATRVFVRYEHLNRDEVFPGDLRANEFFSDPTVVGRTASSNERTKSNAYSFKLEHDFGFGFLDFGAVRRIEDEQGDGRFSPPRDTADKSFDVRLSYRYDFKTSNLIIGGEIFDGDILTDEYAGDDIAMEGDVLTRSNSDLQIKSLFAQYSINLTDRLNITVGVRHEDITLRTEFLFDTTNDLNDGQIFERKFNNTSPKFGVTYDITDKIQIWGGYSRGFLPPDIGDLFLDRPEANPNLDAEKADHFEVGVRGNVGDVNINTSYYHTRIDNFLVTEDDGEVETVTNAGQVTVQGVESVIEYAPSDEWRFSATHTYAKNVYDIFFGPDDDGDNDLSGNRISRSPDHHLNVRAAWSPIENLVLEGEGDFYTGYYTRDDNSIDPDGKFTRGERLNFRASYSFGQWDIWFHALNLTDTLADRVSYSPPRGGRPGRRNFRIIDGRTFYGGIAFRF